MYSYYDPTIGQTVYFGTQAEKDAYIAKKGGIVQTGLSYAINGKLICIGNGSAVQGATVELFKPLADGSYNLIESCTTAATTGAFTSTSTWPVGSTVMVHVQRQAAVTIATGGFIYDRWILVTVGNLPTGGGLVSVPIGTIEVWPSPRATPTVAVYMPNGTAFSTTNTGVARSALSKAASGTVLSGMYAQLNLVETWATFGHDPWTQPKTSKGHEQRDYVTVATIAWNVTGISWQGSSWSSVSVTTGMKRAVILKGNQYSPFIIQTMADGNRRLIIDLPNDMSGLANNTGVAITVDVTDYQLWDNAKDNTVTTTIGTSGTKFGTTFTVQTIVYVIVRA